jgi:hypothetical protein
MAATAFSTRVLLPPPQSLPWSTRSSDEDDELIRTDEEPPLKKNFLSPHLMKQQRFALVSPPQHYMSFMQPDFTEWKKPTLDEFESSAGKRRFRADFENKC